MFALVGPMKLTGPKKPIIYLLVEILTLRVQLPELQLTITALACLRVCVNTNVAKLLNIITSQQILRNYTSGLNTSTLNRPISYTILNYTHFRTDRCMPSAELIKVIRLHQVPIAESCNIT